MRALATSAISRHFSHSCDLILVRADAEGNLTAIAPDEARAHLATLWDRLLDVDSLDKVAAIA